MSRLNLTLAHKLLGGFAAVLLLCGLVGLIAISKTNQVRDAGIFLGEKSGPSMELIQRQRQRLMTYRSAELEQLLAVEPKQFADAEKEIAETAKKIGQGFAEYEELINSDEDRAMWQKAKDGWNAYRAKTAELIAAGRRNDSAEIRRVTFGEGRALLHKTADAAEAWGTYRRERAQTRLQEAKDTAAGARTTVIVLLLIAIGIGTAVAVLITRGIRRNVSVLVDRMKSVAENDSTELRDGLRALADGDLTRDIKPVTEAVPNPGSDELGDVARALNVTLERTHDSVNAYEEARAGLISMISEVAGGAEQVSAASTQVASGSEETGRAIEEIARAVTEVAAGAEQQSRAVDTVRGRTDRMQEATSTGAEEARGTGEAARRTRELANEGAQAVAEATTAMQVVRASSDDATGAIRQLGTKSQEISGIVDRVTSIAEQTNLLALNAAIEAARAGDQGRGFAVVADEVRKLAEESQGAAASIAELVGQIQSDTTKAVEAVEAGAQSTTDGTETVERAREAFEAIGAAVEDTVQRVEQIATAVESIAADSSATARDVAEVASVTEQTSAATEEVSASTEQTTAATQEIAASAQELASTAEALLAQVSRFRLTAA